MQTEVSDYSRYRMKGRYIIYDCKGLKNIRNLIKKKLKNP